MEWRRYTVRNRYPPCEVEGEPCTCWPPLPPCVSRSTMHRYVTATRAPGGKAGDDVSRLRRSDCRMETCERQRRHITQRGIPTARVVPPFHELDTHARASAGVDQVVLASNFALERSTLDSLPANSSRPVRRGESASPRTARPLRRTDAGGVRADTGRDSTPRRVAPDGVAACQARRTRRRACPSREEKRPANQGDRPPSHAVWTLLISQGAV